MKFVKKPVEIEAIQYSGANATVINAFTEGKSYPINGKLIIPTLEGEMQATEGDWIIKGVNGEFYPCKPDIFEKTYDAATGGGMSFGAALEALKQGKRVCREGWNGKGMWLALVTERDLSTVGITPTFSIDHHAYDYSMAPWIGMKTADNMFVPWLASQTDVLANDWMIVE